MVVDWLLRVIQRQSTSTHIINSKVLAHSHDSVILYP